MDQGYQLLYMQIWSLWPYKFDYTIVYHVNVGVNFSLFINYRLNNKVIVWIISLKKLEQLECLHSENTPGHPMITHTLDTYRILSQNKTKSKLQILKNCQYHIL